MVWCISWWGELFVAPSNINRDRKTSLELLKWSYCRNVYRLFPLFDQWCGITASDAYISPIHHGLWTSSRSLSENPWWSPMMALWSTLKSWSCSWSYPHRELQRHTISREILKAAWISSHTRHRTCDFDCSSDDQRLSPCQVKLTMGSFGASRRYLWSG